MAVQPVVASAPSVSPAVVQPVVGNAPFQIDPISDGALIAAGVGFGGILELILSTGEIRPQRPVDPNRAARDRQGRGHADLRSERERTLQLRPLHGARLRRRRSHPLGLSRRLERRAGRRDSLCRIAEPDVRAFTDLAKIAVRRPRPSAYVAQAQLDQKFGPNGPSITATDQSLSFFSGHAAILCRDHGDGDLPRVHSRPRNVAAMGHAHRRDAVDGGRELRARTRRRALSYGRHRGDTCGRRGGDHRAAPAPAHDPRAASYVDRPRAGSGGRRSRASRDLLLNGPALPIRRDGTRS